MINTEESIYNKMTIVYCTHNYYKMLKLNAITHFSKYLYINE